MGAGKYNDGARENRVALALRLADGMKRAWDTMQTFPVSAANVQWRVEPVALPVAAHLDKAKLRADVANQKDLKVALDAADHLAWLSRCKSGHKINIAMLGNRRRASFTHAGRAFCGVSACRQEDAPRPST